MGLSDPKNGPFEGRLSSIAKSIGCTEHQAMLLWVSCACVRETKKAF